MLHASHAIQLTVVALLGFALVMVHSAGLTMASPDARPVLEAALQSRHLIYAGIAIVAMLLAGCVNVREAMHTRWYANPILWGLAVAIGFTVLTFVPGLGRTVNSSTRWLTLGPISFQPSELVKWTIIPTLAWWCATQGERMKHLVFGVLPAMMLLGFVCGLIVIEDFGTAALIGLVGWLILLAGGARLWQLILISLPGVVVAGYAIASSPYRWNRLVAFLDPWADPEGIGYHPIQSMVAIAEGGLAGRGLGNGVQKFGYLPEDTTDFLFAVICEELGLIGALAVVAAYLLLMRVGFGVARDCRDPFARLLAFGVILTVGLQAAINLAVVTVLAPTKGIALPLLSAGGTGWILTAAMLGLVAAVDVANRYALEDGGPADGAADETQDRTSASMAARAF